LIYVVVDLHEEFSSSQLLISDVDYHETYAESHDVILIEITRCSGISHSGVVQEYPSRILEIFSLMFFSIALKHTPFDRAHRAASNEVVFMTGTHFSVNRHMKQSVKGSSQTF